MELACELTLMSTCYWLDPYFTQKTSLCTMYCVLCLNVLSRCKAAAGPQSKIRCCKMDTWTTRYFMVLCKPLPRSSLLKPAMCVWLADSLMSHRLTTAASAVFWQTPRDVEKPVGLLFVELQLGVTRGECGHMKAVILKHTYDFRFINARISWLCKEDM